MHTVLGFSHLSCLSLWSRALLLLTMLTTSNALGVVDIYEFESESQRERYFQLSEELRCPKCQNQNLAGSDSQIAGDLRRELRRLLAEDKSDQEIKQFMVDRYGEFVLYKPRLQQSTIVLWGLPLLLLLAGGITVVLIVRRKHRVPAAHQSGQSSADGQGSAGINALTDQEQQKLNQLLGQPSSPSQPSSQQERS